MITHIFNLGKFCDYCPLPAEYDTPIGKICKKCLDKPRKPASSSRQKRYSGPSKYQQEIGGFQQSGHS